MFTLGQLDRKLSIKLGDPLVTNSDGELFSAEVRKNYIARAYTRLVRILKKTLGNKAPNFVNINKIEAFSVEDTLTIFKGSKVNLADKNIDTIKEIYIIDKDNVKQSVLYVDKNSWLSIIYGKSDLYSPNMQKAVYAVKLDNELHIVPQVDETSQVIINYISYPDYLDDNVTNDTVINITSEYVDMLLLLAASEGMMDIARSDKVQLYVGDFNNQLAILTSWVSLELQLEGKNSGI